MDELTIYANLIKNCAEISILSNTTAYLNSLLEDINWVGFYCDNGEELILGPFQGKVACTNIKYHNGVLGKAFQSKKTIIVDNVHEFSGHIACDSDSNSEIVIPIFKNGKLKYLMDLDSPKFARFVSCQKFLESVAKTLEIEISTNL